MPTERPAFPSDRKHPLIEVFFLAGHEPFICGANGRINTQMLEQIEKDLAEEPACMNKGDGTYLFEAAWEPDQTGEFGRVELPGYWDLSFIAFQSVDEL